MRFGDRGGHPLVLLDIMFPPLLWRFVGLGERLELEVLCHEQLDVVQVESGVGVDPLLHDRQLGSGSVDVGHSGCSGFMLVGR